MENKREVGYYWVKIFNKWEVAKYIGRKKWEVFNAGYYYNDSMFDEIIETPIPQPK